MDENEELITVAESSETQEEQFESASKFDGGAPKKKRFYVESSLFALLLAFGFAIISSMFLFQVWLTPIMVVGTSMQPTLNVSVESETDENHCDFVLFEKEDYYNNNDIVIVSNKDNKYVNQEDVNFIIKRVVACPGQTIRFYITGKEQKEETLDRYVFYYYYNIMILDKNGKDINLDQSYLDETMYFISIQLKASGESFPSSSFPFFNNILTGLEKNNEFEYNIPDGKYFVMGDNRNGSEDSRYFGAVDYDDISGAVKKIVAFGTFLNRIFYWRYRSL